MREQMSKFYNGWGELVLGNSHVCVLFLSAPDAHIRPTGTEHLQKASFMSEQRKKHNCLQLSSVQVPFVLGKVLFL